MIHLIYISSVTSWPTEEGLVALLDSSRSYNEKHQITGMLIYSNATYMQVLEGETKDVHQLFEKIQQDTRHTGIVKLLEEEINERDFPKWSMGFKDLKQCSPEELPGFIDIFNECLDTDTVLINKAPAIKLLLGFAKNLT